MSDMYPVRVAMFWKPSSRAGCIDVCWSGNGCHGPAGSFAKQIETPMPVCSAFVCIVPSPTACSASVEVVFVIGPTTVDTGVSGPGTLKHAANPHWNVPDGSGEPWGSGGEYNVPTNPL